MTSIIHQYKAIKRKLDCQEQKADFEEKNPPVDLGMYGYPSNLTPLMLTDMITGKPYLAPNRLKASG